jgi:hypothetical protein
VTVGGGSSAQELTEPDVAVADAPRHGDVARCDIELCCANGSRCVAVGDKPPNDMSFLDAPVDTVTDPPSTPAQQGLTIPALVRPWLETGYTLTLPAGPYFAARTGEERRCCRSNPAFVNTFTEPGRRQLGRPEQPRRQMPGCDAPPVRMPDLALGPGLRRHRPIDFMEPAPIEPDRPQSLRHRRLLPDH